MDTSTFVLKRHRLRERMESVRSGISVGSGEDKLLFGTVPRWAVPIMKQVAVVGLESWAMSLIQKSGLQRWLPVRVAKRLL